MADVIVTGGAGFIGSNLVDALVERGDTVHVVDNLASGKRENLREAIGGGAVLHEVDVRDLEGLDAVFGCCEPELVFHLAAQIDVRRSVEEPAADAQINVLGAINVLECCRRHEVPRVVYSCTGGALYGDAELLPTPEEHPIRPLAAYGQSKYAAEGYFELYDRLYGVSSVSLRYGNVYGPRQDVHGEAGVVAIFCGKLLQGAAPTVYGDGRQTRDWVHVTDVVHLLAAESAFSGPLNVGHGRETSVLDLIAALTEVGAERGLRFAEPAFEQRLGEVRRSCMNVDAARRQLSWEPNLSLRDGLRTILEGLAT